MFLPRALLVSFVAFGAAVAQETGFSLDPEEQTSQIYTPTVNRNEPHIPVFYRTNKDKIWLQWKLEDSFGATVVHPISDVLERHERRLSEAQGPSEATFQGDTDGDDATALCEDVFLSDGRHPVEIPDTWQEARDSFRGMCQVAAEKDDAECITEERAVFSGQPAGDAVFRPSFAFCEHLARRHLQRHGPSSLQARRLKSGSSGGFGGSSGSFGGSSGVGWIAGVILALLGVPSALFVCGCLWFQNCSERATRWKKALHMRKARETAVPVYNAVSQIGGSILNLRGTLQYSNGYSKDVFYALSVNMDGTVVSMDESMGGKVFLDADGAPILAFGRLELGADLVFFEVQGKITAQGFGEAKVEGLFAESCLKLGPPYFTNEGSVFLEKEAATASAEVVQGQASNGAGAIPVTIGQPEQPPAKEGEPE